MIELPQICSVYITSCLAATQIQLVSQHVLEVPTGFLLSHAAGLLEGLTPRPPSLYTCDTASPGLAHRAAAAAPGPPRCEPRPHLQPGLPSHCHSAGAITASVRAAVPCQITATSPQPHRPPDGVLTSQSARQEDGWDKVRGLVPIYTRGQAALRLCNGSRRTSFQALQLLLDPQQHPLSISVGNAVSPASSSILQAYCQQTKTTTPMRRGGK